MIDLLSSAVCSNLHKQEYTLPSLKRAEVARLIIGPAMLLFFYDSLPQGPSQDMTIREAPIVQAQH